MGVSTREPMSGFRKRAIGKDWERRLLAEHLNPSEFTQLCAEGIEARLKDAQVSIVGPLELTITPAGGNESRVYLHNRWQECRDDPAERVHAFEQLLRSLSEAQTEPKASISAIVPVIRDSEFVREYGEKVQPYTEHLVADLWIVYAQDAPNSIRYGLAGDLGMRLPEVRQRALANLRRILPRLERHGDGSTYYMLTAGGVYESSLLLLEDFWRKQARQVDGELVAAVPTRDVLLFTGSHCKAGMRELKSTVARVYRDGSYPISATLLVWRNDSWQLYESERIQRASPNRIDRE
jgi:uncharacterized protein YtpQ (UPF0354 family)